MNENQNKETKKCKHCQSDIPKKAKICPNCRKKQGGIFKWFLIVIIALVIIGSVGGNEDKPTKVSSNTNESTTSTTTSETVAEETTFGVGDTAEYRGVKVTLNSVEESNGSQFNKPTDGNVFLLVNFTIENSTDSDLVISSLMCFDAYQDGYATNLSLTALLEKSGNQLDGTVAPGKKMQGYIGYEVPTTCKEFEVNYKSDMWDDTKFTFIYKK